MLFLSYSALLPSYLLKVNGCYFSVFSNWKFGTLIAYLIFNCKFIYNSVHLSIWMFVISGTAFPLTGHNTHWYIYIYIHRERERFFCFYFILISHFLQFLCSWAIIAPLRVFCIASLTLINCLKWLAAWIKVLKVIDCFELF